jgi:SAM-dependent methyltransferase
VGIDIDSQGIYSATDGALSRYQKFRRKYPKFPQMTFIVADASNLLDYENQSRIQKMTDSNKYALKTIFGDNSESTNYKKFDVVNCQFMIHYMLKNDDTWSNFCDNINKYLNMGGYLLITNINGEKLNKGFTEDNPSISYYYNTENGEQKKFFEYKKLYQTTDDINRTGLAIDFFNASFMEEGTYRTEYLTTKNFLVNELAAKCGCNLIDSGEFETLYKLYRDYFLNYTNTESYASTKKFVFGCKDFYNLDDEINKASFEFSRLNSFYVFHKINKISESDKSVQINKTTRKTSKTSKTNKTSRIKKTSLIKKLKK